MYVRIKRKQTTIFMHVEPTDTILELKQKLEELVEKVSCQVLLAQLSTTAWLSMRLRLC
jgi:hypothetical protein